MDAAFDRSPLKRDSGGGFILRRSPSESPDPTSDNVPVAKSVRRLAAVNAGRETGIEVVVFEGSGHALFAPGTNRLRKDFTDLLVRWIHRHHQN